MPRLALAPVISVVGGTIPTATLNIAYKYDVQYSRIWEYDRVVLSMY